MKGNENANYLKGQVRMFFKKKTKKTPNIYFVIYTSMYCSVITLIY